MTRVFVAIRPPAGVLDAIAARVASMPAGSGRVVAREQWHLTLQFLGDRADVDDVLSALGPRPVETGEVSVQLGGATAIGDPSRARILMLGVCAGGDRLAALAGAVEARLAPLAYSGGERDEPFLAHLTLARFRTPTDLRPSCAAVGPEPVGAPWSVREVVVFESRLGSTGAQHVARGSVPVVG